MSASPSCEKEIKQWVDIDKYSITKRRSVSTALLQAVAKLPASKLAQVLLRFKKL